VAAQVLEIPAADLVIEDGQIFARANPARKLAISDVAMGYLLPEGAIGGPVIGRGSFIPAGITGLDKETGQGDCPAPFWTYGTQVADIEVDTKTGEITVLKVTAAYEVGKVINPAMCKGQVRAALSRDWGRRCTNTRPQ
jgi:carbon-monoxide dehydrogenase large subunit